MQNQTAPKNLFFAVTFSQQQKGTQQSFKPLNLHTNYAMNHSQNMSENK